MWRFALLFFIYILLSKFLEPNCEQNSKCLCENHNFCYSPSLLQQNTSTIIGKKFDCSYLTTLKNLGVLLQEGFEDTSKVSREPENIVFLSATSDDHLKFTRKSIESIRKSFPNQKYILYNLGISDRNSQKLLKDFENIEIRKFEFEKFPKHVGNLMEYRWKPLIIAEVLKEYSNVWWMDAHIILNSDERNLTNRIYEERASGVRLTSDIVFTITTMHSNFAVLHPKLLEYFPSSIYFLKKSAQLGANFMYFARTRESLEVVKWWILCALDEQCMGPEGAKIKCKFDKKNKYDINANCFRFDQSVLNLLLLNRFRDHNKYRSANGFANSHY
ncbi:unnamed protein product [Caenorhabditis angaria]|uniref:Glycosyltransferase family 92 protein n=1 Tax=Caenorhabditis angaria TaxID=860376 RepID=A0A9P1IB12_9PELO|nr:unnamed protein product [Caenorhabditis angaria]